MLYYHRGFLLTLLLPFILQGVASVSPDSTEIQPEDTKDPWELQRLHVARTWEFFFQKHWSRLGKKHGLNGYNRACPDCGKILKHYYSNICRHRRFYCKGRQPVAFDSGRQVEDTEVPWKFQRSHDARCIIVSVST